MSKRYTNSEAEIKRVLGDMRKFYRSIIDQFRARICEREVLAFETAPMIVADLAKLQDGKKEVYGEAPFRPRAYAEIVRTEEFLMEICAELEDYLTGESLVETW